MTPPRPITLKAVAREAGVSVSAASYALRGAPNIPEATAARVRSVAEALGYRPHARVAELMAHIRGSRRLPAAERLAIIWPAGITPNAAPGNFEQRVLTGARNRAAALGYRLDEFWLDAVKGNAPRLADILRARGIAGVVFAPAVQHAKVALDWPWEQFAMAVIGTAEWNVMLPRAAHHHYEAMRLAIDHLTRAGSLRPAAMMDAVTNERAHRGWQGAWLAYGPADAADGLQLTAHNVPTAGRLAAWLRAVKPDALIVEHGDLLNRARAAGWRGSPSATVTLSWTPGQPHQGIDQGYDLIAAHAVDLVISQLQRNERGLPADPRVLLSPGKWVEAAPGQIGLPQGSPQDRQQVTL